MIPCRFISLALPFFFCVLPAVQAQEKPQDFEAHFRLETQDGGPWYRMRVPMETVLASHYADLRDIRVFNAAGQTLAYSLTRETGERNVAEQEMSVRFYPLYTSAKKDDPPMEIQFRKDGSILELRRHAVPEGVTEQRQAWLIDVSQTTLPLTRLKIDWPDDAEGFQRFRIEASDDLSAWRSWGNGQVARFRFDDESIVQDTVRLPNAPARYLRLTWLEPKQAPMLHGAVVTTKPPVETAGPSLIWSDPIQATLLEDGTPVWELPRALPIQRLRIDLDEPNTLVPVIVQSCTTETALSPRERRRLFFSSQRKRSRQTYTYCSTRSSGVLYRLASEGEERLQNELALNGNPVENLRLKIDPRGGGLKTQGLTMRFALQATELIFLARGSQPFVLTTGREAIGPATLPLSTLLTGNEAQAFGAVRAVSGDFRFAAPDTPQQPARPNADTGKIILWGVLILGVLLLLGMAFSVIRKTGRDPDDT